MTLFTADVSKTPLGKLAYVFALMGGLVIFCIAAVTVISIVGRTTIGQSVEGDYEITEMGLAIAVFFFLPLCYVRRGHIVVDLFTAHCTDKTIRFLDSIGDLLFTVFSIVFAYRLALSGIEANEYFEQSMILELPAWWMYVAGVISMSLCSVCGLYKLAAAVFGGKHND
ncbi:TRAP transporter small permease [Marinomonas balearica]|uniref:TRAP transporter small permease protein n=1 Tax=Marinomonas balearica TaxID=491947 RepID=A0A4R6MFR3_9GAMM|nr:TRAP transporter small permease [Marinomonas balearica]TDO99600.1 TRAP-type C4-dicarboxylate transport system permease small subunit [Marinomonas balearica]